MKKIPYKVKTYIQHHVKVNDTVTNQQIGNKTIYPISGKKPATVELKPQYEPLKSRQRLIVFVSARKSCTYTDFRSIIFNTSCYLRLWSGIYRLYQQKHYPNLTKLDKSSLCVTKVLSKSVQPLRCDVTNIQKCHMFSKL